MEHECDINLKGESYNSNLKRKGAHLSHVLWKPGAESKVRHGISEQWVLPE